MSATISTWIQCEKLIKYGNSNGVADIAKIIDEHLKNAGIPADSGLAGRVKTGALRSFADKYGNLHFEWTP